jgi:S-layer protein (TIGR01567 family)
MKKLTAITLTALMVLFAMAMTVGAVSEVDVRGQVSDVNTPTTTWDFKNFAGFYYDIDKNIGTEKIVFNVTDVDAQKTTATLADTEGKRGIIYQTTAQAKNFKFGAWGSYQVIGFLADRYFAAYNITTTQKMKAAGENGTPYLYDKSTNRNLMTNEQISKVIEDSDTERTITSANPLKLGEGYQLDVKSIDVDGNKVYVELSKDGAVVDSKVIQPSIDNAKMGDKTYYYKRDMGDTKNIIPIAVHFKNAFRGADTNIATVDGVFQVSDTPAPIKADQQYDKMSIRNVNPTAFTITMDNKDNQISLSKNKNTQLMQNIYIKTADQDATATDPLRYYIYKMYTDPGTYEVRGTVTDLGAPGNTFSWTPMTFAALYYDIDKNIGNEKITFNLTNIDAADSTATLSDQEGKRGIIYKTTAQSKNFKFKPWGCYMKMGFLADPYFAAYNNNITAGMTAAKETVPFIADKSKNDNLMTNEQVTKILEDSDTERTVTSANPLKLGEGYELAVKSIDVKGNKVYVELSKDGAVVDSKVIQPSIDNASMSDKTYYYKKDLGDTKEIVTIATHFKNAFRGTDTDIATVDAVFQISDTAAPIKVDQQYGKMSIRNVDPTAFSITMDNKDNQVTLSKNKVTELMLGIYIKTADQDDISIANPLRYYLYKAATIEAAAPAPAPTPTNVTEVPAPVTPEVPTNVTPAAPTNVTPAKPENVTPPVKPTTPGFECVFAIAGLLAVAFLVLGRRK